MPKVSAALVKELRDATGIAMLKCHKALTEASGDIAKAREILRQSGEKDAAKKSDRTTGEGVIAIQTTDKKGALVQLFCETDFVARGDDFLKLADDIVSLALTKGAEAAKTESTELVQASIQKIGENIQLGEIAVLEAAIVASYQHSNKKIGVLVALKSGSVEIGRDLAMQVAAMNPSYLTPEDVPAADVGKEKEFQKAELEKSDKPKAIVRKILEGKLRKFREKLALTTQPFVKDSQKTITQFLEENSAEIEKFVRLAI